MDDAWQIKRLFERCHERGFPDPIIFISKWGYAKARCPECKYETLLRGYQMHITRAHRPNNYKSRKSTKYGPYNMPDRKHPIKPADPVEYPPHDPLGRYTDEQWSELCAMGLADTA